MVFAQRLPVLAADGYDYADAFAARIGEADTRTAEQVIRDGLENAPGWLRLVVLTAHRYVLRFDLAHTPLPTHVAGWVIMDNDHDHIVLWAGGPLVEGRIVARRPTPSTAVLETSVRYRRPLLAPMLWTAVGPLHRVVAPFLLRRATSNPSLTRLP
ncbi:MAG: DUF2867 domain-containing protein [Mycobacteriaceae bacterium]|nr:DUF2867 domain-containing protein [Mycobacteriaceae bacterium]